MKNKDEIVELLKQASHNYYNTESPIMNDEEFDSLIDQLRQLDPNNDFLKTVGAPVIGVWPKKKHKYFMGSQNKVKSKEEFMKWAEKQGPLVITDKLDGSTIALYYENGNLTEAISRGGGDEGEILTSNVLRMQNVKNAINGFTGVLRGEMIIHLSDFEKYVKPNGYKNARNACSGLSRDTSNSTLVSHIKVIYFDVISESNKIKTEIEKENFVRKAGLEYVWIRGPYKDHENTWHQFEKRTLMRPTLNHEIDGLVVKEDDLVVQQGRGDLNGRPRGMVAIKFIPQSKETIVKDIIWQLGRGGRLAPVLELEPIEIGGVIISRCTGNNRDFLKILKISIGASVMCSRRNDVIPCIESVINIGNGVTNEPTHCSTCNDKLEIDGAYLICANQLCHGLVVGNLAIWIRATKLKGVGPSVLSNLIEAGIDDPYKFMVAEREVFHDACRSEKNGDKIYQQIKALVEMDMATLLYGLNVPHVGEINSRKIAKYFGTMDKLMTASVDELATVPGIKTTADEIKTALNERITMIDSLMSVIKISGTTGIGLLSGISMCVTGELWAGRDEIHRLMRAKGVEVKTSVSKDLTFLITDDPTSGSSKNKKAEQYGVKIISGDTLRALLEGQLAPDKL